MSDNILRGFYPSAGVRFLELDQSSDETESNLPGPGRLLGNAYEHFGRKLESFANRVAARYVRGPNDVALRIKKRASLVKQHNYVLYDPDNRQLYRQYDWKDEAVQRKDLKRLNRYTKFVVLLCLARTFVDCMQVTNRVNMRASTQ